MGAFVGILDLTSKLFGQRCNVIGLRDSRDGLEPNVKQARARAMCLRVANILSECLGCELGAAMSAREVTRHAFWVSPSMISSCGYQFEGRKRPDRMQRNTGLQWRYRCW